MPSLHAFVISWPGHEENAGHIAAEAGTAADHVTVIHSCPEEARLPDRPGWVQVPDGDYYGAKFARCLVLNRGEVMLQLHADARSDDWGRVVRHCREAFERVPDLGLWAPDLDYTPYPLDEVQIGALDALPLVLVAHTDSIVWGLSAPVLARLRDMDLGLVPLGWGLDWAAASFCVAHGLLVVRDRSLHIQHPRGSGYQRLEAERQMLAFLLQLTPAERVAQALLAGHIQGRRQQLGRPLTGL